MANEGKTTRCGTDVRKARVQMVVRLAGAGTRIGVLEEVLVVRRFFGDNLSYGSNDDFSVMLGAVRRHHAQQRAKGESRGEVIGGG